MAAEQDGAEDELRYGRALDEAYAVAFPTSVQIRVGTYGREPYSNAAAAATTLRLSSLPVIDRCLHRGAGRAAAADGAVCVPHVVCDLMAPGDVCRLPPPLRRKIVAGRKLDAVEKTTLAQLRRPADRTFWTVAYAALRCDLGGFRRACVVLFFRPEPELPTGHANMVSLLQTPEGLEVSLYEPNGREAAQASRTVRRFFPDFARRLGRLLERPVRFRLTGLALQTQLGRRWLRRFASGRTSVVDRGYPVCAAVVLWLFSLYTTQGAASGGGIAAFEAQLLRRPRRELKAELLAWVVELAAWVQERYAAAMGAQLRAVFEGSNVGEVLLQYGCVAARL